MILSAEKIRKLQALADPLRNPSIHEARAAQAKLDEIRQGNMNPANEALLAEYHQFTSDFAGGSCFGPWDAQWQHNTRKFVDDFSLRPVIEAKQQDLIEFRRKFRSDYSAHLPQRLQDGPDPFLSFLRERRRERRARR
jgi:hypothetical protein